MRLVLSEGILDVCGTLKEEGLKEDEMVSLGSRAVAWCGMTTRVKWGYVLESMVAKLNV